MSKIVLTFASIGICLLAILGDSGSCRTKEAAVNKAPVERNDKLATGVWGGQHIRAEVTDRGADIEFDCAHGAIDQPWKNPVLVKAHECDHASVSLAACH